MPTGQILYTVILTCAVSTNFRFIYSYNIAREYVHYIAEAVREKVAGIIVSKHFMSVMSDGSQARKTNDEKELILVRIERAGILIYIVTSLLEMSSRGGTDAESIKLAIDSVFSDNEGTDLKSDNVPMSYESYRDMMVSATADGANVNFGIYNGLK